MSSDNRFDLVDWLTFKRRLDFAKARWLGPLFAVIATLLVALSVATAFTLLGKALFADLLSIPGSSLGVGGVTVALISAPFVIWRSIVAQKQADIAEQGLITDRINKAVEGLGAEKTTSKIGRAMLVKLSDATAKLSEVGGGKSQVSRIQWLGHEAPYRSFEESIEHEGEWTVFTETKPNLEVRIGAIYALERIMQDSARDHIQITEMLCAYIRQNAGLNDPFHPEMIERPLDKQKPSADVEAAIKVIGRRSRKMRQEARKFLNSSIYRRRFDLKNVDLTGADLRDLMFADIDFSGSSFRYANLMNARFNNVSFNGSDITHADTRKSAAIGETTFSYCLFSGLESLEIIEPLKRDQVLWCALRSTEFGSRTDLERLIANKKTMLSVWFGDGSVGWSHSEWDDTPIQSPSNWNVTNLPFTDFVTEWRKWQFDPNNYTPPVSPTPKP